MNICTNTMCRRTSVFVRSNLRRLSLISLELTFESTYVYERLHEDECLWNQLIVIPRPTKYCNRCNNVKQFQ